MTYSGDDDRDSVDLCMAIPPFDQIKIPLLGPALLTAACRERGLTVRNVFGSILLAARTGYEPYKAVSRYYLDCVIGERLFRPHGWPPEIGATLPPLPELADKAQALHDRLAPHIAPFVDEFVEAVLATRPRIVAIVSTFEQIMAGSALAWRVKQAAPDTIVVMGGANIAAPMGAAFAGIFPWVDHFFSGEADVAFPEFCERLIRAGERPAERVIECAPIDNIAISPTPDFTDFLEALEAEKARGRLPAHLPEGLPLESSRGCWWGMKNHCTFCGLNGSTMDFRTKTPERMIGEIRELVDRYDPPYLSFTDNIMPLSYLQTVLPELATWERKPSLFYEVKANLKYEQLRLMCRAGMTQIQPGIESLSTNVLKLMRKGISGIQNLVLLRNCASLNLYALWNILYGFPGEQVSDYEHLPDLFPRIEHFRPPGYCVPIVVDRFSPHHKDPEGFGIGSYKPYPGFAALFPPGSPLMELGYHFIGQHTTAFMSDGDALDRLHGAYDTWHALWTSGRRPPILTALEMGPGQPVLIADTRRIARQKMTPVSPGQDAALRWFETPRKTGQVEPEMAAFVPEFIDRAFLVEHEGYYLSVVTRPDPDAAGGGREHWVPVAA
ncbi:MAG TPA: RiPP maturation radical SAM C-methyltransferase [Sphingopyxis sp.]|nr:RiPP maturation radical SAM C-methyltransferase [Sphingopyxis sp.]HMP45670.1 RiPP maturation radical SAM C-methyltransferase [Sphingopyxis sp.]HMQ17902.1 RiPP maturation radical SAM C-methyltransferase [Sphingopyxis sp.]